MKSSAKLSPAAKLPLLAAVLSGLLLAACSQNAAPAAAESAAAERPAYLTAVAVAGQSAGELATRYGARVLSYDAAADVALLGFTRQPSGAQLGAQGLSAQQLSQVEANTRSFSAGGRSSLWATGRASLWATGRSSLWATGRASLWATGQYQPVQENTASFKQIGLDLAHAALSTPGKGVKVAVIDTGIDLNHVFFQGSLAPAAEWRDFVDGDSVPQEVGTLGEGAYGHGTAVAGIVLEVAPHATILPLRVLGSDGGGDVASLVMAIDHAVKQGARIINLSLGSAERSALVQSALDRAAAAGVLVIASAGNDNLRGLNYPAQDMRLNSKAGNHSLSLGSVDSRDLKAPFSNYGSALELTAPGEMIFAPGPGDLLVAWSGTSMSTPIASGALALGLSLSSKAKPADLSKYLAEDAYDLYNNGMNAAYKDMLGKKGRLDVPAFLKKIKD